MIEAMNNSAETSSITVPTAIAMVALVGPNDEFLRLIEKRYPKAIITCRGAASGFSRITLISITGALYRTLGYEPRKRISSQISRSPLTALATAASLIWPSTSMMK